MVMVSGIALAIKGAIIIMVPGAGEALHVRLKVLLVTLNGVAVMVEVAGSTVTLKVVPF